MEFHPLIPQPEHRFTQRQPPWTLSFPLLRLLPPPGLLLLLSGGLLLFVFVIWLSLWWVGPFIELQPRRQDLRLLQDHRRGLIHKTLQSLLMLELRTVAHQMASIRPLECLDPPTRALKLCSHRALEREKETVRLWSRGVFCALDPPDYTFIHPSYGIRRS